MFNRIATAADRIGSKRKKMDSHPMKLEWWPALRAAADAGRRAVPVGAADGGRRPAACAVAVKEHSAAASMESGSRRW